MDECEGEVGELVVFGVDAEEFDDCFEGFVADFDVLRCSDCGVFEHVSWGPVEDDHGCVVQHAIAY